MRSIGRLTLAMTTCIIHANQTNSFQIMQMRDGKSNKERWEIYPSDDHLHNSYK